MAQTELNEFKINYLTDEQYKTAKESGTLSDNELYMTPDVSNEILVGTGEPTDDLGNDGDIYFQIDGSDNTIYSTSEIRIGIWLNKPLYRKVITGVTATGTYNHGISNFGDLVNIYGAITKSNGGKEPIPRIVLSGSSQYGIAVGDVNGDRIYMEFGSSYSGVQSGYVVLEYTKTTD